MKCGMVDRVETFDECLSRLAAGGGSKPREIGQGAGGAGAAGDRGISAAAVIAICGGRMRPAAPRGVTPGTVTAGSLAAGTGGLRAEAGHDLRHNFQNFVVRTVTIASAVTAARPEFSFPPSSFPGVPSWVTRPIPKRSRRNPPAARPSRKPPLKSPPSPGPRSRQHPQRKRQSGPRSFRTARRPPVGSAARVLPRRPRRSKQLRSFRPRSPLPAPRSRHEMELPLDRRPASWLCPASLVRSMTRAASPSRPHSHRARQADLRRLLPWHMSLQGGGLRQLAVHSSIRHGGRFWQEVADAFPIALDNCQRVLSRSRDGLARSPLNETLDDQPGCPASSGIPAPTPTPSGNTEQARKPSLPSDSCLTFSELWRASIVSGPSRRNALRRPWPGLL